MQKKIINVLILSGMMGSSLLCMKETPMTILVDHKGCACVAISPNGKYLATGGKDKKLKLWKRKEGKSWGLIQETIAKKECICSLKFYPSNTLLAVGYEYGSVVLFEKKDAFSWTLKQELSKTSEHFIFTDVQIEKLKNAKFIDCFSDLADKVENPNENEGITNILGENAIEKAENPADALSFDPNGDWLVIGFGTGILNFWKKNEHGKWIFKKSYCDKDHIRMVNFDESGKFLLAAGTVMDSNISLYEKKSDTSWEKMFEIFVGHCGTIPFASFDASGSNLITGCVDGTLRSTKINLDTKKFGPKVQIFEKTKKSICAVAMNAGGTLLAYGDFGYGEILLYEKKEPWSFLRKIGYHRVEKGYDLNNGVRCLVFDPSNDYLISGGIDGTVRIWNISQAKKTEATDKNLLIEEKAN